jgi:hypothetical protein
MTKLGDIPVVVLVCGPVSIRDTSPRRVCSTFELPHNNNSLMSFRTTGMAGLEPATTMLTASRSTTELHPIIGPIAAMAFST